MTQSLLIFIGAGLGGICRFWISQSVYWFWGQDFPYGTLVVNITGSFFMGLLYSIIFEKLNGLAATGITHHLRLFLLIGFLGGYTTFSSFTIETINLYENGHTLGALSNIILSVVICIFMTILGVNWGRLL